MKKLPKISFIICTYFGERTMSDCLKSLIEQDYPKEKMEILIADGGSKDETLKICKRYQKKYPKSIKIDHNKAQYDDGKGAGKDTFSRKAKGDLICFIDQDNILVQKDWIKRMLVAFENPEISAVQSRMAIVENDSLINKYLSAIGIEDPFVVNYSLNAQITLNPKKFKYNKEKKYFICELSAKKYFYAGNNGFMIRKKEFFEAGGYNQDVDNFYRMAKKNYIIAVPKNAKLHHSAATDFKHMLQKRTKYVVRYLEENYEDRDFFWFDLKRNNFGQNLRFINTILFNILFIPGLIQGIYMSIKTKGSHWLLHPIMLSSITWSYIIGRTQSFINTKILKKGFGIDMSKQNN